MIPSSDLEGELVGFPYSAQDVVWGIHLCFYHGLRNNKSGDPYPYASSHIYDSNFNQVAQWALTFECKKADGTDVGLHEKNWKKLLTLLSSPEQLQVTLNLPLDLYHKLKFSDRIFIAGVMMWVKEKKSVIPYNGSVELQCIRIMPG